jgi:hypothetical protein
LNPVVAASSKWTRLAALDASEWVSMALHLSVDSWKPLPSPAIRSLTAELLNRTEVVVTDSVVLGTHTRGLRLLYFGCLAYTLVWMGLAAGRSPDAT